MANLTDKQRAFCRHYVANGGVATSAARAAGYAEPGPEGFWLIRKRHILEEIERLHAAVAKAGNAIMAKALSDSQGIGNDDAREPASAELAAALVPRRGADDEARAVVSMAYRPSRPSLPSVRPTSTSSLMPTATAPPPPLNGELTRG